MDRGAVSQKTGLPPRGRRGPEAGHPPRLAEADPVGRSRQARTKIPDMLVEILSEAASDAGSTPAASTIVDLLSPRRLARWLAESRERRSPPFEWTRPGFGYD